MAQFLRPDSDITTTSFNTSTGSTFYTLLDEISPSDADYAWSDNNANATLEVGLSNPGATPESGTCTCRYRIAKTNNGTVTGTGSNPPTQGFVYEGATLIASDTNRTPTATWTTYSFTFSTSLVTSFNDLRFRLEVSSTGGRPADRRGSAVSWAEVETPDGAVTRYVLIT